jgi:hypothetical protein
VITTVLPDERVDPFDLGLALVQVGERDAQGLDVDEPLRDRAYEPTRWSG